MDGMRRRVLVVDDDLLGSQTLLVALADHGFRVDWAATIKAALEAIVDDGPDVVLLDLDLGREHGTELITAAKSLAIGLPPIVVITGAGVEEQRAAAMKMSLEAILSKPFATGDLIRTLQRILSN